MNENTKIITAALSFSSNKDAEISSKYLDSIGLWSDSCNSIVANCKESYLMYDIEFYKVVDALTDVEKTNYWKSKDEKIWRISLITDKGITLKLPYVDAQNGTGYIVILNSNIKSISTVNIELLSDNL